jgi:hypothetical protein
LGEGLAAAGGENDPTDIAAVLEDVPVPEPEHAKALRLQAPGADRVVRDLDIVLTAVDLHDQTSGRTEEVYDIAIDRDLAAPLPAGEPAASKGGPKVLLGVGGAAAERTRPLLESRVRAEAPPSPYPLPPKDGGRGHDG